MIPYLLQGPGRDDYVGDDSIVVVRERYGTAGIETGLLGQTAGLAGAYLIPTPWVAAFWVCVGQTVLSTALLAIAGRRNATMTGYAPALGLLLGALSLPGVFVLMCLPDRDNRTDSRHGFDVIAPKPVSSTWVVEESLTDPNLQPRRWGTDADRAKLWRGEET